MSNNRTCPNGHEYDASIYGDKCPFCPPSGVHGAPAGATQAVGGMPPYNGGATQVIGGASAYPAGGYGGAKTQVVGGASAGAPSYGTEKTQMVNGPAAGGETSETVIMGGPEASGSEGKTEIRRGPIVPKDENVHIFPPRNQPKPVDRRVVGLLVTYDHNPAGDVHRINEGTNSVGRESTNTIPVPRDREISGQQFKITFRPVDNAYFIRDEQSVNGTYVNGELLDLNTTRILNNYDIIRAGSTTFIFLAIPKID